MRSRSLSFLFTLLLGASACLFFSSRPARSSASSQAATLARQPVVLELFTSEGCSSCPPADSLLQKLSEGQPFDGIEIIVLEEHVDYWNHDGWFDPFSSSDFTLRQQDYAARFPDAGGVYTPQIIVDGRSQFVGSRTQEASEQIRQSAAHPKSRLLLTPASNSNARKRSFELRLDPSLPAPNSSPLELWVAITEKGLHSNVSAGENSGQTLYHSPVVRQLRKLHSVSFPLTAPITFTLDLHNNWNVSNLTVVAFLSQPHTHEILAAGSSPLLL